MFLDIKIALDSKLNSLSGTNIFAWENISHTPVIGTSFIRPSILYSPSSKLTLDGMQLVQGIYQIDVFFPVNKGVKDLIDKMDDIYDLFREQILESDGTIVTITTVNSNRMTTDKAWIVGTVDVYFNCYNEV